MDKSGTVLLLGSWEDGCFTHNPVNELIKERKGAHKMEKGCQRGGAQRGLSEKGHVGKQKVSQALKGGEFGAFVRSVGLGCWKGVEDMASGWSAMARGGGEAEVGALLQGEGFACYRAREGTTCPLPECPLPTAIVFP